MQGSLDGFNVDLSWTAVPGATGYEIWAGATKTRLPKPFAISTGPSVAVSLTPSAATGIVTLEVHPVIGGSACTPVAASLTVPPAPNFAGATTSEGIAIAWSLNGDYDATVDILRGLDQQHLQVIATVATPTYLDKSGEAGTVYSYSVRRHRGSYSADAPPQSFQTPIAAATNLTATPKIGGVLVGFDPPKSGSCTVSRTSPLPDPNERQPSSGLPCPALTECSFAVACTDPFGHKGPTATVAGHRAPDPPSSCTVTSQPGGIRVEWAGNAPDAASFRIERMGAGDKVPVFVANAAGSPFTDTAVAFFHPSNYRVVAVASDGAFDDTSFCFTPAARKVTAADEANLAPSIGFDTLASPGQTFPIATGGQLMGIELLDNTAFDSFACLRLLSTDDPLTAPAPDTAEATCIFGEPPASTPHALSLDAVTGTYFDLSSRNILVSAGETLRFQLDSDTPFQSADSAGGNATGFGGSADLAHDLIYKTYVLPSSDLPAPVLTVRSSGATALLSWTASPGALRYDVIDSSGATVAQTHDTHATVTIPAAGTDFHVVAVASSGAAASSNAVSAVFSSLVADAANLCTDAADAEIGRANFFDQLVQTFTAQSSGLLAGFDVDVEPAAVSFATPPIHFAVEDVATGAVLATTDVDARTSAVLVVFPPLSPTLRSFHFVDLSASGAHVTAGQLLRIRIGGFTFGTPLTADFTWRDSGDDYPGGAETLPSPSILPHDLCFKTYLDPTR
ncbi:MAG TPA: hypothetical protein VGH20_12530 [Myxococcales bacterium]